MPGGHRSLHIAKAFEFHNHKVDILSSDQMMTGWKVRKEILSKNITIYWLPVLYSNDFGFYRRMFAFLKFCLLSSYFSIKLKPELIFATSTPLTISIPALLAKIFKGTSYIFEVRDLWPQAPIAIGALKNRTLIKLAKLLEFHAYKNAETVICLSPDMEAGVKLICPEKSTHVIPNFCDLDIVGGEVGLPHEIIDIINNQDSKIVLYAGTLGAVNNVSYLIDIALETKLNSIKYIVIGSGSEWETVKSRAKEKGIYNVNFFMLEPVEKNILKEIFKISTLSLSLTAQIPELAGNSANKFFDSLAFGCPIFINHEGWLAELINKNKLGGVLPGDNPKLAYKIIEEFVYNNKAILEAKKNGLNLAKNTFNKDTLTEKLCTIINHLDIQN